MITRASLFRYHIFCTLVHYETGTLQDTLIVHLGVTMLLARRRPFLHQLHGVHLGPLHLHTGESPACTFDADGPLYDFQPWAGIHKPPHQAELAVGKGVARPHPDYKAPHGLFGRLVQLDQLLQLVAHMHWVFDPSMLRPEQLLRRASLHDMVVLCGIQNTVGQICERSLRAPDSGK